MKLERWIDPFARAEGPPPDTLLAFLRWAMTGGFKVIGIAGVFSALAGTLEVTTAVMLGWVIDAAISSDADGFFSSNAWMLLGVMAFFVILRPMVFGISGVMQSVGMAPALNNLILSRLHRHTIGQAVGFFDNDFAGRISQKQMQAARAMTELAVDMIHTIAFALASVVASVLLLFTIDLRSAALLSLWVAAYVSVSYTHLTLPTILLV